ncbi:carbohydrate-binding module family 13 protein [Hydnum rufescens UP504]|uniref:Carbohydrate-binding module family 13 protein n=1 Tax=Hydnum rufescens UP504 TaxID=1448309 RepID=A0A9P6AT53_9AGAM|nr:carbohydrate-binding module family 13 protein [Hydnum rufescens UP504]
MDVRLGSTHVVVNANTGYALDLDTNNNKSVIAVPVNNKSNQQWTLEDAGDGYVRIKNKHGSGKYLSIGGDTQDGAHLICSPHQQTWRIIGDTEKPNHLRIFFSGTQFVVDGLYSEPGYPVNIYKNNGGQRQAWIFELVDA